MALLAININKAIHLSYKLNYNFLKMFTFFGINSPIHIILTNVN